MRQKKRFEALQQRLLESKQRLLSGRRDSNFNDGPVNLRVKPGHKQKPKQHSSSLSRVPSRLGTDRRGVEERVSDSTDKIFEGEQTMFDAKPRQVKNLVLVQQSLSQTPTMLAKKTSLRYIKSEGNPEHERSED